MLPLKLLIILLFTLLFSYIANAQIDVENKIDINLKECISKDTSTGNLYLCAFEAYAAWDKIMARDYKKLIKTVKTEKDRNALKQAQNAWLTYRDNEFKSYDNMFNHQGYKWCLLRATGRINIVKSRALQLELYLESFTKK